MAASREQNAGIHVSSGVPFTFQATDSGSPLDLGRAFSLTLSGLGKALVHLP